MTHKTVENWIKKYVNLINECVRTLDLQLSEKWRIDEPYVKVGGEQKYAYAIMDDQTRYLIAKKVSDNKYADDLKPLFQEAQETAKKIPQTLVSDGAANFHDAWQDECRQKNPLQKQTRHVRHVHLDGDYNNNKMERLNGTLRGREKIMRSLKRADSPIITGIQIHYNYIRPHMGLDGKTPCMAAGIKIEGNNAWITLIQNAKRAQLLALRKT